ncbi:hypothetical protein PVK06_020911 [Gossypium arboreum]|uniref:Uncharacterized protein n=1 Tax=Gossypium arboreum TaxID=29729 RepID=A0ABR0PNK6_GOSAR|nr:hypothetical protein PVK06_020911 [Gossypium arboreum]
MGMQGQFFPIKVNSWQGLSSVAAAFVKSIDGLYKDVKVNLKVGYTIAMIVTFLGKQGLCMGLSSSMTPRMVTGMLPKLKARVSSCTQSQETPFSWFMALEDNLNSGFSFLFDYVFQLSSYWVFFLYCFFGLCLCLRLVPGFDPTCM